MFWRIQRKDTHYLVSSIGQNLVGGILAILLWSIFRNTDVQREKVGEVLDNSKKCLAHFA